MKTIKNILTLLLFISLYSTSYAQQDSLLNALPSTKEEFVASEKKLLASINWLENTPLNQDVEKHKTQYALLIAWITNSPTVTIEIKSNVLTFTEKNSDLLVFFMAGWTKFSLENNYSSDLTKGNVAGIRSAIKIYKQGIALKKDKEMQKLIDLDDKGKLETWVTEKLAEK
jgi:hypothetical protein